MTLGQINTFTGGTTISGGIIYANSDTALGTGTVSIDGGRLILNDGVTISNTISINSCNPGDGLGVIQGPASGSATLKGTINITTNKLSGGHFAGRNLTGGLIISGPINADPGIDVVHRSGRLTLEGGGTYYSFQIASDTVVLGGNGISPSAVVDIGTSGNAFLDLNGLSQTIAGLRRTGSNSATVTNSAGGGNLTINSSDTNYYSGTITSQISIEKKGSGLQSLDAENTYTGLTIVSAGELRVNGSTSPSGDVHVHPGAILSGNGNVQGTTYLNDGILKPGNNGAGKLRIKSLIMNGTLSVLEFDIGTNSDTLAVDDQLTLNGTLNINAGPGFKEGTYTIMTYGGLQKTIFP